MNGSLVGQSLCCQVIEETRLSCEQITFSSLELRKIAQPCLGEDRGVYLSGANGPGLFLCGDERARWRLHLKVRNLIPN